jgi:hypothetical protein
LALIIAVQNELPGSSAGYEFVHRLVAKDAEGSGFAAGGWSTGYALDGEIPFTVENSVPPVPEPVTITDVHRDSFRVNWPLSNAAEYKVNVSTEPAFLKPLIVGQTSRSGSTVIGDGLLAPGTTYYVQVYAQSVQAVDSGMSGTVSVTTSR